MYSLRNVALCLFVTFIIGDTLASEAVLKAPAPEFTQHRTVRLGRSIRDKREIPTKNEISLTIPLDDKDVVLDLKLNFDILPSDLDNRTRSIEEESLCEYIGKVRGVATSRAALSVCGDPAVVQGTFFDGNNTYYIEPATSVRADGQEPLYYVYNRRDLIKDNHKCSTRLKLENSRRRRAIFYPRIKQEQYGRRSNKVILRILFVTGASLYRKKATTGTTVKEYTRRLINEVYSYYTDLDVTIQYAGSIQMLSKIEKSIIYGSLEDDVKVLNNFNEYMLYDNNDLPQEYDAAVFLSEDAFRGSETVGLAFTGSVCGVHREDAVAAVTTNQSWFMTSTTVAHEVGHLLGLRHEEFESRKIPGCPNDRKNKYIMCAFGEPDNAKWSPCSKAAWRGIRNSGKVNCLFPRVYSPLRRKFQRNQMGITKV